MLLASIGMTMIGFSQEVDLNGALSRFNDAVFKEDFHRAGDVVDSLLLNRDDPDAARLAVILQARLRRFEGKPREAYALLGAMAPSGEHMADIVRLVEVHERARCLKDFKLFDKAREEGLKALNYARAFSLKREEAGVELLLGDLDKGQGKYDDALGHFLAADKLAGRGGFDFEHCNALLGRGNVLFYQERLDACLEMFKEARSCAEAHGYKNIAARAVFNMGSAISFLGSNEAAIEHYEHVLAETRTVPNTALEADVHAALGQVNNDMGNYARAKAEIDTALSMMVASGDTASQVDCLHYLAITYEGLHMMDKALGAAQRSLELSTATGALSRMSDNELRINEILLSMGQCERAMEHLQNHHALDARLDSIKQGETIYRLEIAYDTEKKEQALLVSNAELKVSIEKEEARRNQRNWLIGLSAMLVLLAVVLFRNFNSQKRLRAQEHVLHEGEVNDLMKRQEINSLDAMMKGQEQERQRVGKDLHDRIGSMLSAVKFQFSALEGRMEDMEAKHLEQYNRVFSLLDETVVEVRRISHDMVRGTLSQFGLVRALEDLRSAVHTPGKLNVVLSMFGMEERLEQNLEIAVYRMVQECVSNVMKHAQATELSVQLTRTSAVLNILVEDDGRGFDPAGSSGGLGMANIRERAAAYKGSVNVDSRPGRGTTVSIDVPLIRLPEVG